MALLSDFRFWLQTSLFGLALGLLVPPLHCLAQGDFNPESISTEQGLSQGAVFDILQDREGFLWIGTKDGLNRYDGYTFRVFTNDPDDPWSISGNTVTRLFEDSRGRIWAASDNAGINIYDKRTGRFHHIRYHRQDAGSLSGSYVSYIVEDTSGFFIVGVDERELEMFKLEDDFFQSQTPPRIIRLALPERKSADRGLHTILKGVAQDAKGRIWVGGQDVIYHLDVEHAQFTLVEEGYSLGTTFANPDGSIWTAGATYPLFRWDGQQAVSISEDFKNAREICLDDQGRMWLLRQDTLFGFDMGDWKPGVTVNRDSERCFFRWHPRTAVGEYPFMSMAVDRSGVVWVGTNGLGLYKFNPNRGRFALHLPGISVRQIAAVADDEIYIQEYAEGWFRHDATPLQMNPLGVDDDSLRHDFLLVSRLGDYWVRQPTVDSNENQIKKYDPHTGETLTYPLSLHHYDVQPMIECLDGSLWMAGFDHVLTRLDPETGNTFSYDLQDGKIIRNNFDNNRLYSREYSTALYEDTQGVLWVGSERGITKCIRPSQQGEVLRIEKYQTIAGDPTSLSYNHVMCFLDDPSDPGRYLWVCTKGGGLNRLDKTSGTFLRLTREDGLPDNVIYCVLSDGEGNLWGSTNQGLFCMSKGDAVHEKGEPEFVFRNFTRADGLQDNEFNTGAYAKLPGGKLAFGGINGLNIFDPQEVLADDCEPNVFLTSIAINNKLVVPQDETGILTNTIETTGKITLTHLQDILTLEFAALDFRAPDRIKYRYQLIGADDAWVLSGNHRSATFLHLRPGNYTFRVQGSNSRGIWSKQMARLDINVLPPWWRTWWAYATYIVLIGTAIWVFIRFRINRSRLQQQLAFEQREADRVREMDTLKTRLFMNMTHEFRTPLSIILGMARQVLDDPKEHFRSGMDMIIRNGQNLLGLVNKMLNLSKLESGKLTLDLVQDDVVQFLRNLVESFRSFAAHKEIQLHFLPEVDEVVMDYDPDKLQQVISNLISNAFKFTPEGGHIYFAVRKENSSLIIRIKDTGCGIPKEDQQKIFDRFYQVESGATRHYEGTGIGLALTSELVKLMQGEIHVESPPAGARRGSEFFVHLPIHTNAQFGREPEASPDLAAKALHQDAQPEPQEVRLRPTFLYEPENGSEQFILLVEDNSDIVAYVASCLSDYRLAVAANGKEGLEMAIEMIPDVIISDVMMPVMDGFELCRRLKSDMHTDHIPIVLLTARADFDSKLEGLEFGANAYLIKPFEKQELILTLKNLFELRNNLHRHYRAVAGIGDGQEVHGADPDEMTEDAFVLNVRDIITAHLDDSGFTVESLAKELHLSHSQLGRKLDALTGLSPNRFMRAMRLKKAQELLLSGEESVTAVAYDCGFSDPSYFSRVFKKEMGCTPVEWVQRQRQ